MTLADHLRSWDEQLDIPSFELPGLRTYIGLYDYAEYLGRTLYSDYERDYAPNVQPFLSRLEDWILGAPSDDHKRALFELLFHIRFVARQEIHCLYQSAYRGNVIRWLMSSDGIPISKDFRADIIGPLSRLWIGSGSDSFHLDTFFHITGARSKSERRPAFLDLAEFPNPSAVALHMSKYGMDRVGIFEDFVGTGTQIRPAIEFILSLPNTPEVLVCPIFSTTVALDRLADLIANPLVTYDPVVLLAGRSLLPETKPDAEPPEYMAFRHCVEQLHDLVAHPDPDAMNPYGFGRLGVLLVQFGNSPDNSPPLIWNDSDKWQSLFPRKRREGKG